MFYRPTNDDASQKLISSSETLLNYKVFSAFYIIMHACSLFAYVSFPFTRSLILPNEDTNSEFFFGWLMTLGADE